MPLWQTVYSSRATRLFYFCLSVPLSTVSVNCSLYLDSWSCCLLKQPTSCLVVNSARYCVVVAWTHVPRRLEISVEKRDPKKVPAIWRISLIAINDAPVSRFVASAALGCVLPRDRKRPCSFLPVHLAPISPRISYRTRSYRIISSTGMTSETLRFDDARLLKNHLQFYTFGYCSLIWP